MNKLVVGLVAFHVKQAEVRKAIAQLQIFDRNRDGRIDAREGEAAFAHFDVNSDGKINASEKAKLEAETGLDFILLPEGSQNVRGNPDALSLDKASFLYGLKQRYKLALSLKK